MRTREEKKERLSFQKTSHKVVSAQRFATTGEKKRRRESEEKEEDQSSRTSSLGRFLRRRVVHFPFRRTWWCPPFLGEEHMYMERERERHTTREKRVVLPMRSQVVSLHLPWRSITTHSRPRHKKNNAPPQKERSPILKYRPTQEVPRSTTTDLYD